VLEKNKNGSPRPPIKIQHNVILRHFEVLTEKKPEFSYHCRMHKINTLMKIPELRRGQKV